MEENVNTTEQLPHPLSDLYPKAGGVNFRYLELNGQKLKWQVIPVQITAAGTTFPIKDEAHMTDDRIIGVVLTNDDIFNADGGIKSEAEKCINDSLIKLSIDNEELFPSDFSAELISQKIGKTLYQCMYPCNERAFGSQIEGHIKSSTKLFTRPFTVKVHLLCIANKNKK